MAVTAQTPYTSYTAAPFAVTFSTEFRVIRASDLVVRVNGVTQASGFTLFGLGDAGGVDVQFDVSMVGGEFIELLRMVPLTRATDYQQLGDFAAPVVNQDFDRLWMSQQDQGFLIGGALRVPFPEQIGELPNAVDRADRLLGFDSLGQPVAVAPVAGTAAALAAALAASGGAAQVGTAQGPTLEQRTGQVLTTLGFASLQAAVDAAAGKTLIVVGTHTITANIVLPSNITIEAVPGAVVQTSTLGISHFFAENRTGIKIKGLKFLRTAANGAAFIAGVHLLNCTRCKVTGCEFEGMQWSGVFLDSSNWCTVENNYIFGSLVSAAGDRADIHIYRNSHNNTVEANRCYGGKGTGIFLQDPGGVGLFFPYQNKIRKNKVGAHEVYGILAYIGTVSGWLNSFNSIEDNEVDDIEGDPAIQLNTGTGIYVVGTGTGGIRVTGNNVRNACIETTLSSNGPAGITIADYPPSTVKAIVKGNTVSGMTQGDGILISGSNGVVVENNSVNIPSSNAGAGPGGSPLNGQGVKVVNSSNVAIDGNPITVSGTGRGIWFNADAPVKNNSATNNTVVTTGAAGHGIASNRSASNTHTNFRVQDNTIEVTGTSANALNLTGIVRGVVSDNVGTSGIAWLYVRNVLQTKMSGNSFNVTTGSNDVDADGTNTGSVLDETNEYTGSVFNSTAGLIVRRFGDAAPATGTAQIGDAVIRRTSTVGQSKGWRATTAGSPGTWTSEGNL